MATATRSDLFSDLAQAAIAKYLKQAVSYEKLVLADTDPEDLHQMRVGLRRLRTALQVFGVGVKLPKAGREPRVAAVARHLGELRDLDVIAATLRERYSPDLPDNEQALLAIVLDALQQQRSQVFKSVKDMLKGKRYKQMKKSLKAWSKAPAYKELAQLPATFVVPDLLAPLVSHLWLHPGWLVGTKMTRTGPKANTRLSIAATDALISEQGPILHSLRKQVKRVRYQLKLVSDMYNGALDADLQRITDMQTTLGDLQDSAVLEDFIADSVPEAKQQMPTLFALLADSRHRAWKQWQAHQQYYLDASHRQQLRLAVLNPAGAKAESQPTKSASKKTSKTAATKSTRRTTRKKPSTRRTTKARTQSKPAALEVTEGSEPAVQNSFTTAESDGSKAGAAETDAST